ncbi:hypothetical protein SADUNF_Sadunf07G0064700 [Salix dunnii]|uniref:Uncharacterized protein n=1 Tax=Salix dunnii TaxID=1413687 RepID=A0A835JZI9_9ROSI|nr:hypothetical protein SADUNF_Sadunf07G0064700 [Salix dunnii]
MIFIVDRLVCSLSLHPRPSQPLQGQPHFATNKDVDVMAFAKDLEKIYSSMQDLETKLIVATTRDTTTNDIVVSANAVVDERKINALFFVWKRVKEIEERRGLEKKVEELQSRMMDDNSQEEKEGSEENKKERVGKEPGKGGHEQAERRATVELIELEQKAYAKRHVWKGY